VYDMEDDMAGIMGWTLPHHQDLGTGFRGVGLRKRDGTYSAVILGAEL
jgi:hypothetical protein